MKIRENKKYDFNSLTIEAECSFAKDGLSAENIIASHIVSDVKENMENGLNPLIQRSINDIIEPLTVTNDLQCGKESNEQVN